MHILSSCPVHGQVRVGVCLSGIVLRRSSTRIMEPEPWRCGPDASVLATGVARRYDRRILGVVRALFLFLLFRRYGNRRTTTAVHPTSAASRPWRPVHAADYGAGWPFPATAKARFVEPELSPASPAHWSPSSLVARSTASTAGDWMGRYDDSKRLMAKHQWA